MQELSKAIFVNLAEDEQALTDFHTGSSKQAMGQEALDKKGPAYWNRRVRRMVRAAHALKQALTELINKYSGADGLDSRGVALLTESTREVLAATFQLIDAGSFCGEYAACTLLRIPMHAQC